MTAKRCAERVEDERVVTRQRRDTGGAVRGVPERGRPITRGRRGRGAAPAAYVREMRDPTRWEVRKVAVAGQEEVRREVWYREHDGVWCHRYTVSVSPMLRAKFGEQGDGEDEMLGIVAARTYRNEEAITVYVGDDIGAADGTLDAYKGYHAIADMAKGATRNKGRHVMEILTTMEAGEKRGTDGQRRMWRRLIDGYHGHTCAQYANAAYQAPKGFRDKARLCDGGTMRVKPGCVIHEGEEILFTYGKAYWDRWRNKAGSSTQLQTQKEDGAQRHEHEPRRVRCARTAQVQDCWGAECAHTHDGERQMGGGRDGAGCMQDTRGEETDSVVVEGLGDKRKKDRVWDRGSKRVRCDGASCTHVGGEGHGEVRATGVNTRYERGEGGGVT